MTGSIRITVLAPLFDHVFETFNVTESVVDIAHAAVTLCITTARLAFVEVLIRDGNDRRRKI